jgi:glyoxylase-like metal-dependent hydrolase (beta-lactamase superfamily II)
VQQIPPDEAQTLAESDRPEELEPGLWRIPLPLPFALRSANTYLFAGAGEYVLVDCGLGTPEGDAALRAGLGAAGIRLDQITTLVLTHAHPDHIGLAGPIHDASGAPLRLLPQEADRLYRVWGDPDLAALRESAALFAAHGLPSADQEHIARSDRAIRRAIHLPAPETVAPVVEGEIVTLAGARFRVHWAPGHSDYHLCLLREDGVLVVGDHVLARITPNIGFYPNARPDPLGDYYEGLARVRDLDVRLVLPGHGRPFADLAGRVDELRAHHVERSAQTLALLGAHRDGASAYTIAAELFGARLRTPDDRRFALAETLAHLEYLRHAGDAELAEHDGRVTYRAVQVARVRE